MQPFLAELANSIQTKYRTFDKLTIVFPNRRAILYFRKHLSTLLSKPAFAPKLLTIEDYFNSLSNLKTPDKLELIHHLYEVYYDVVLDRREGNNEPFHQFYFWGEMLLRDFDETDKYLVDASQLFKDLRNQKELDTSFDYLTEEQLTFLKTFWATFDQNLTENKKKFIDVWSKLHLLYLTFKSKLLEKGIAYEGMLQHSVAEKIEELLNRSTNQIVFAGFNALTKAEEKIIAYHVQQGIGEVYWDIDAYYLNNTTQEAGKFFREYQNHAILGKTFPEDVPSYLSDGLSNFSHKKNIEAKSIRVFGAAHPVSQTKVMAQVLQEELEKGINPEETLIVLPDENLLLPVLHSVAGHVEKLNVTMGFPIGATPVFNLIEILIELHINRKGLEFN
ncbi:MAG TPA: PD-(D/E)XK nuclease family protein, partial [Chryseolinea sp.]|nr:PD-(D/E)XK nuclease family protein [Chryseolinea sp.]